MDARLTGSEVAAVLRNIAVGFAAVELVNPPEGGPSEWFNEVGIRTGGYSVSLFFDCGDLDYVDAATAPDGRTVEFQQMWDEGAEPVRDLLTDAESNALVVRLAAVSRQPVTRESP